MSTREQSYRSALEEIRRRGGTGRGLWAAGKARTALEAAAKAEDPYLTLQTALTERLAKKFGLLISPALMFDIVEEIDAYQRGGK